MIWTPVDLNNVCTPYATITSCQPATFAFLQLVISLFGSSKDSAPPAQDNFVPNFIPPEITDAFSFNLGSEEDPFTNHQYENTASQYDFIIVGAGTAGCILANRLSQIPDWKILLLEAGGEEPEAADVPAFAKLMQGSSIDWNFATQPQQYACKARRQGQCSWARGKVMGGSSAMNYMIYLRGGPKDYNEWAAMGNPGWSYEEVLPYFKRLEHNANLDKVDPRFHGTRGEMNIEYFPFQDQNVFYFLNAFKELGLDLFDQNSDRQIGASLLQHYTRDGQRFSSNIAFVRPIRKKRKNLTIKTEALVTRVLVNPHTKTAYGVEYFKNGKYFTATAKKEVIISAGSILSPKLLMLSGIGPAHYLKGMNIQVIQDLSVGYNLHDHTTIDGLIFALTNLTATIASQDQQVTDLYKFKQNNRGPLSGTATLQVNAYIQTKYEREENRPDIQLSFDTTNTNNFYTDPILTSAATVDPISYYNGVHIRPILLSPKSRGFILLNQTNPVFGYPLIFSNTFQQEEDLLRMVDGIQQSINIGQTQSLKKIGASLVTIPLPACQNYLFGTNEYWSCVSVSYTTTIFHPVGTCKMGPKNDPTAVVDPEGLRVYGINRLRVIDASIMPIIVRGNINAATMVIAEKGADFIKRDWLKDHMEHRNFVSDGGLFESFDIGIKR